MGLFGHDLWFGALCLHTSGVGLECWCVSVCERLVCAHVNAWEHRLHPVELAFNLDGEKNKPEEQSKSSPPHKHTHTSHRIPLRLTQSIRPDPSSENNRTFHIFFSESCGSIWQMQRDNYIYLVFRTMHFYSLSDSSSTLVWVCGRSIYVVLQELLGIDWLPERVCSIRTWYFMPFPLNVGSLTTKPTCCS